MPEWEKIIEVYGADEARLIIYASQYLLEKNVLPKEIGTKLREKCHKLAVFLEEKEATTTPQHPVSTPLSLPNFDVVSSEGTRSFVNRKGVDWEEVESILERKGVELRKREFLNGRFDHLCPIYYLASEEYGIFAEGKGLSDEQARRSAMAEGVERIFALSPQYKNTLIVDTYEKLYAQKKWDLGVIAGPRDPFAQNIITEWLPAANLNREEECYLPAEICYLDYSSQLTKIRLFSLHHSTGLAAGSSFEEAALNGFFEVLERDAYWITMRCKIETPDIDLRKIIGLDPKILEICNVLDQVGLSLFLKDMSLDWDIPIAHAILRDRSNRIPAFTHGTGAAFTWPVAVSRAVCEALQMYSGQSALIKETDCWQEIAAVSNAVARPELIWSDPLYFANIEHLLTRSSLKWRSSGPKTPSMQEYLATFSKKGHEVIATELATVGDLKITRTVVTNSTQPDPRLERISPRLENWRKKQGLKGFYTDPILS